MDNNIIVVKLDKDLCNSLSLIDMQLKAYQNLFNSYVEQRIEEYKTFNLDKFLKKYADKYIDRELLIKKIFDLLTDEVKQQIEDHNRIYTYDIDYMACIMTITFR